MQSLEGILKRGLFTQYGKWNGRKQNKDKRDAVGNTNPREIEKK